MRVRRHRVDLRRDHPHGVAVPITPRALQVGRLLKTALVSLMLFVGVCTLAGMVGWLLGTALVELGDL